MKRIALIALTLLFSANCQHTPRDIRHHYIIASRLAAELAPRLTIVVQ